MKERERFLSIITKNVITASEKDTAREIACLMKKNNVGVVVILKNGKVAGIVSERDISRRIVAEGLSCDVSVQDFITKKVLTVDLKEGLNKIYQTLCEIDFRHLPVVDNGRLIGITSRRDLLDVLSGKYARRKR